MYNNFCDWVFTIINVAITLPDVQPVGPAPDIPPDLRDDDEAQNGI